MSDKDLAGIRAQYGVLHSRLTEGMYNASDVEFVMGVLVDALKAANYIKMHLDNLIKEHEHENPSP